MPRRISVDHEEPDKATEPVAVMPNSAAPAPLPHAHTTSADRELNEKSGTSVLAAFAAFPKGVNFAGEHAGEEIVLLLRAHLVTNVPWILGVLGMWLAPLVILPIASALNILGLLGGGTLLALILFWYLGSATYGFLNFLYWYFNVGIITNERIVDIDWVSLTHREVTMALISKIQDVTPKQIGVLAGIFDFGSVFIQTAGTEPNIEFLNIPHPQLVARKIQELMQEEEREWETNLPAGRSKQIPNPN